MRKASKLYPVRIDAYKEIAKNYISLNDETSAIKIYEKALEYAPNDRELRISLSKLYINTGDTQNGLRKIRTLYAENKDDAEVSFLYGVLLAKQKEFYKACEVLEKTYTNNPDMHIALFMQAECLCAVGKAREALTLIAPLEETNGEQYEFLSVKFACYQKLLTNEENNHLIDTLKDICDKIISLYPNETWVLEEKSKLDNNRN